MWQRAADRGNLEALEKLWVWAKEVGINTEELFLRKSIKIKTAWQIATQRGHFEILQKI